MNKKNTLRRCVYAVLGVLCLAFSVYWVYSYLINDGEFIPFSIVSIMLSVFFFRRSYLGDGFDYRGYFYSSYFSTDPEGIASKKELYLSLPFRILVGLIGMFFLILLGKLISIIDKDTGISPVLIGLSLLAPIVFICLYFSIFRKQKAQKTELKLTGKLGIIVIYGIAFLLLSIFLWAVLSSFVNLDVVIIMALTLSMLLLMFKVIKDNYKVFIHSKKGHFFKGIIKAFFCWAPLLVFLLPGMYLSNYMSDYSARVDSEIIEKLNKKHQGYVFDPEELECGWDPFCHLNPYNKIKKTINAQYLKLNSREKSIEAYQASKGSYSIVYEILGHILNLLLIFTVITSYLKTLSRFVVSSNTGVIATLKGKTERKGGLSKVLSLGKSFDLNENHFDYSCYYINRLYEPDNAVPNIVLPQPSKAVFRRLLSNSYVFNKIELEEIDQPILFTGEGSEEFVVWELEEGQEVIFDFKNLVAMSQTINLKSVFSFKVPTLVLGKSIFSSAKGPGVLIFKTKGLAHCYTSTQSARSVPLRRVLAWSRDVEFDLMSDKSIANVYFSSVYLKPTSGRGILVDSDVSGKKSSGIVSYIKDFLIPI